MDIGDPIRRHTVVPLKQPVVAPEGPKTPTPQPSKAPEKVPEKVE